MATAKSTQKLGSGCNLIGCASCPMVIARTGELGHAVVYCPVRNATTWLPSGKAVNGPEALSAFAVELDDRIRSGQVSRAFAEKARDGSQTH